MLGDRHDPRSQQRSEHRAQAPRHAVSLAKALARGEAKALVSCAGQGVEWLPELRKLADEPGVALLVEAADAVMHEVVEAREARWSGLYADGWGLKRWLAADVADAAYLASTPVSMPAILLTQIARHLSVARR